MGSRVMISESWYYGPRQPRKRLVDGHMDYLKKRLEAFPGLTAQRLMREVKDRG